MPFESMVKSDSNFLGGEESLVVKKWAKLWGRGRYLYLVYYGFVCESLFVGIELCFCDLVGAGWRAVDVVLVVVVVVGITVHVESWNFGCVE